MLQLIILLPLLGAALIGLGGLLLPGLRKNESLIGWLSTAFVAIPFLLTALQFGAVSGGAVSFQLWDWMSDGSVQIAFGYRMDHLSWIMAMVVNGVGALIHMYSIGYMHGDKGFYKFFAYLNLFIFAMNNLILGDNMVVMFLGWEGVGLCSYLLIGFWYSNMAYSKAAQKAFVVNRIGDFAMMAALFIVFRETGGFSFEAVNAHGFSGNTAFWLALLVFIAATGKSAQIPLFTWLPDAMAGPTPVSALIHAATMVTAGVYLIARIHPVFLAAPDVMMVVSIVAMLTAVVAALTAVAQNDIKKVLAYSTVSQLGFMFMALGAGAFTTAIFHVFTHAFFKACLFLGSGSVIHAMEHTHSVKDPQDIRTMGGLGKYMPATSRTFFVSTLAIAGIPPLAGFFSKDEILSSLFFNGGGLYKVIWVVGLLTAVLTAFYMTRLWYLVFQGKPRFDAENHPPHESGALMTIPLWVLAAFAVFAGFLGLPAVIAHGEANWIGHHWLSGTVHNLEAIEINAHAQPALEMGLIALSALLAIGAVLGARNFFRKNELGGDSALQSRLGGLYGLMAGKFFFDELYERFIVRPFNWIGGSLLQPIDQKVVDGGVDGVGNSVAFIADWMRKLQTGLIQNYVLLVTSGAVALLAWLIFG